MPAEAMKIVQGDVNQLNLRIGNTLPQPVVRLHFVPVHCLVTTWISGWVARSEVLRRACGTLIAHTPFGVPQSVPPNAVISFLFSSYSPVSMSPTTNLSSSAAVRLGRTLLSTSASPRRAHSPLL